MDIDRNYQHALDYIYSFVDYSQTRSLTYSPEKFNLEKMTILLERLDKPHLKYPVVHVAGTKGKGSVSVLITSALQAAGYRTGFYSSPHLQDFCERIQVNGEVISHSELVKLLEELKPYIAEVKTPTTFEITTALAFLYFARYPVDIAVIEVGLGGRLDSTNLVLPEVSVITSISYDHMAILGNTLTAIAGEKAGIIKPGRPVVSAPQKEEAMRVIEDVARTQGSPLWVAGRDIKYAPKTHSLDGQSFWIWMNEDQPGVDEYLRSAGVVGIEPIRLPLALLGRHQVDNAATAYTALQLLNQRGFSIDNHAVEKGFSWVTWPGRFEILARQPFLVIDSAHNRDSALKLWQAMEDYFPDRQVVLIFGASEDKDIQGMLTELLPCVQKVVMTQSMHPRALNAVKLQDMAALFGIPVAALPSVNDALAYALDQVKPDGVVLAAGSLFIAAAVRAVWLDAQASIKKDCK
jgi:dihydrofolate synthase/folylpolyglutamate synthase